MAQVSVKINNRAYQVACADGQEAQIAKLAEYVDRKVKDLAGEAGQVGDARLLVMASLMIADELGETYDELEELRKAAPAVAEIPDPATVKAAAEAEKERAGARDLAAKLEAARAAEDEAAARLDGLAERIEAIAERLARA
ncbi:MAG: cell division protein ZapA [Pseudomonadota bacterium]